ncbi:hypothetical protein [Lactobacillus delbrueckii]|uniref:hypothetical protein n=1 Tax=Lactobacillus delbrueckii TaxID=1584 RepID=UPI001787406C|nr:hypothetical protein [Lactobacillus delbrueckii]MBD5834736.1 hypothetical protein [Lactobacillus delbrueckii]
MNAIELAYNITKEARSDGLALAASVTGENFISIISTKTGERFATVYTAVLDPYTWLCYTEFPSTLLNLLRKSGPFFGNSKPEWLSNTNGDAYFEIDEGYMIIEEAVTLTNGERLKGWVVKPPEISDPRTVEYNLIDEENERYGRFCFWQPGKARIRILKNSEVKKFEVISDEN